MFFGKTNIMQKKRLLIGFICLLFLTPTIVYSQEKFGKPNFHIGIDIQTKYIWRGMEMMTSDAAPVFFPVLNYSNKGFYAYVMGGYSINGKYAEVDIGLSYTHNWLTIGINNYYYPETNTPEELGGHYDFLNGHSLSLAVGAAINKSCYNSYEHDFSICNIELKYIYNVVMKNFSLPLSVAYIINPVYKKAHVNLTASFVF